MRGCEGEGEDEEGNYWNREGGEGREEGGKVTITEQRGCYGECLGLRGNANSEISQISLPLQTRKKLHCKIQYLQ